MTNVNPVEVKEIYLDKLMEIADEVTDEALSYHLVMIPMMSMAAQV